MDKERMRADHWLGLVLYISFNALTWLSVRKDKQPIKNHVLLSPKASRIGGDGGPDGNQLTQVIWENFR